MRKIELGEVINIGGHYLKTLVEGLDPYQEYEEFVKATGKTSVLSFVESIQDFGKVTDKVQMSDLDDDEETFLHWKRPCTRTQMNALLEVASDQVKALDNWALEIVATSYLEKGFADLGFTHQSYLDYITDTDIETLQRALRSVGIVVLLSTDMELVV